MLSTALDVQDERVLHDVAIEPAESNDTYTGNGARPTDRCAWSDKNELRRAGREHTCDARANARSTCATKGECG